MILLVSGATRTVRQFRHVGEFIVPGAHNDPAMLRLVPGCWAMDNGAYSGFDAALFVDMLRRFHGRLGCRFVAAPDVVADAHATLQLWPFWARLIRGVGFPPALVLQDGLTVGDVPWGEVAAVFVGGSTEWKLGPQAVELVAYAKARGLWVHVGRVNSRQRIWSCVRAGVDSCDGTGFSWFPETRIPKGQRWIAEAEAERTQARLAL